MPIWWRNFSVMKRCSLTSPSWRRRGSDMCACNSNSREKVRNGHEKVLLLDRPRRVSTEVGMDASTQPFDLWLDHHFLIRVGVSLFCGCLVGLEREWRGKPTGVGPCAVVFRGAVLVVRPRGVL